MASAALVARDGYHRNSSGQFTSKTRNGYYSGLGWSESIVDVDSFREGNTIDMKAGPGKVFGNSLYDAASDDSSSLNRKSMSLNVDARSFDPDLRKGFGVNMQGGNGYPPVVPMFPIPVSEMSKLERREWRIRLKRELEQVRNLSLRIEAREQQLRGFSHSVGVNPSFSDAQFSGNDVRSCVGKEVTSSLDLTHFGASLSFQRDAGLARQHSFSALDTNHVGPDLSLKEKRTPKANQLYRNSDFFMGKDKMPPPEKLKSKSTVSKRAALTRVDSRDSKRQMVDNRVQSKEFVELLRRCSILLKKLMAHKHGWVFNVPVDVVKLGLSDYHLIVKKPMDLGTIKGKLNRRDYISPVHFAEDVRLTFSNAMTYNPPGNDVHVMAQELRNIFEEKWKAIEKKCEEERMRNERDLGVQEHQPARAQPVLSPPQMQERREDSDQSQAKSKKLPPGGKKPTPNTKSKPKPKTQQPKREMTFLEKKRLSGNLQLLPADKLEYIVQLMKERNPNLSQKDDEIEVDIDTFDNDTLWELHRYVASCMKSIGKNKKKAEQSQVEQNSRDPKNQVVADGNGEGCTKNRKAAGETGDEDVDIDDDLPDTSFPPVEIDKDAGYASRSSSSGSSSSDSGSSSDSDSGSSSGSDSDAEDAQSADRVR